MATKRNRTFLGRGWAFPIAVDATGAVQVVEYEEDIRQSILILLGTNPGERVMRPNLSGGLNALVFQPMNTATISLAKMRVEEVLIEYEPRIDQIRVTVTPVPSEGKLEIEVSYRVRLTNTFYNLVYPFYLNEGTA